ncbi:hypothetical protein [Streptosporangium carneum]|uniref:Uncharacterized protein n=1 Tax=Streptosporangium carneum TaxID=47481 RepID=A0A9W6MG80_9ACTN|nr:hypothetical protein [Streptosporangium carneum]GLK12867.1 hypothetical protein GCM10017600_62770 [Streptosporangium carneum]
MPETAERGSRPGRQEATPAAWRSREGMPETGEAEPGESRTARRVIEILFFAATLGVLWTVHALLLR